MLGTGTILESLDTYRADGGQDTEWLWADSIRGTSSQRI